MTTTARQRMIASAIQLMRERGVEATSFAEVLSHSGAPRGSIYHHFPEGKSQLIMEATRQAGDFIAAAERHVLERKDARAGLKVLMEYWRSVLRDSEFAAGCPVAAATVDNDSVPAARNIAGDAFAEWAWVFAGALRRDGVSKRRADSLATMVIAATEGAVILARAQQSIEPLDRVARELRGLIDDALDRAAPR
jgi:AcrR family transcriptional regulator